jgi:hypothetical protein
VSVWKKNRDGHYGVTVTFAFTVESLFTPSGVVIVQFSRRTFSGGFCGMEESTFA